MAKRDGKTITLGSGEIFLTEFTGSTLPDVATICVENNRLGYVKNGASIEYTQETYEESDDLGYVKKVIVTKEDALLKLGVITWNGNTLKKLIDRCGVTEASGKRTTKIGGAGHAQGKKYCVCFQHLDAADGNVWVMIVGNNNAGLILTFASENGTVLEPEFKALPHDTDGTLIEFIEEIPTTGGGG